MYAIVFDINAKLVHVAFRALVKTRYMLHTQINHWSLLKIADRSFSHASSYRWSPPFSFIPSASPESPFWVTHKYLFFNLC